MYWWKFHDIHRTRPCFGATEVQCYNNTLNSEDSYGFGITRQDLLLKNFEIHKTSQLFHHPSMKATGKKLPANPSQEEHILLCVDHLFRILEHLLLLKFTYMRKISHSTLLCSFIWVRNTFLVSNYQNKLRLKQWGNRKIFSNYKNPFLENGTID